MTDYTLPPIPERYFGMTALTDDQVRDYGKACADAAIDRCIAFLNAEQEDTQMHNYAAVYANKLRGLKGKP